jgi:hypothetical protein
MEKKMNLVVKTGRSAARTRWHGPWLTGQGARWRGQRVWLNKPALLDVFKSYRLNIAVVSAVFLTVAACAQCARASAQDVARARKVAEAYHKAWVADDMEKMFELTSRKWVKKNLGVDPDKSTASRALALERFSLLMRQARDVMGYRKFEVQGVARSRPDRIVFKFKVHHRVGGVHKTSMAVRRVIKENGKWKVF